MGRKQPEESPSTFFVDDSVRSNALVETLKARGHEVVVNADLGLPRDALDEEWIPVAADRGCVILTKDKRIRKREEEHAAYVRAGAAVFFLTSGNISGEQIAVAFEKALGRIERLVQTHNRPLVALVDRSGKIELREGERRGSVRK